MSVEPDRLDDTHRERRIGPRRRIVRDANLLVDGSLSPVPCLVLELSANGAKLHLHDQDILPQRFSLIIEEDGLLRACDLVWQRRNHAGVTFSAA